MTVSSRCGSEVGSCRVDHRCATTPRLPRIRQGYLRKPCISDTPEIRSLRLVLAEKQTSYQTVLSDTPEIRSLKPALIVVRRARYYSVKNVKACGCTCLLTTITRPSLHRESLYCI